MGRARERKRCHSCVGASMCVQFEGEQVKNWQTSLVTNCIRGEIQKPTIIRAQKAVWSVYWCNFRVNHD